MTRRSLGTSGLSANPVGLGGMPMSLAGRPPESQSIRTIHVALDAGAELIDTADVYCIDDGDLGHNERLIAAALREWRGSRPVVATKGGLARPNGEWVNDGRPASLKRACDRSLAALGVDAIDVYQLHAPDRRVPFADSVGALAELRAAGKVRHVGLSNVSVDQIDVARAIVPVVSVQNRCNVYDRKAFRDGVVAHCVRHGIAFLPYSPVGGRRERAKLAADPILGAIAERHGVSRHRVAIAWLLAKIPVAIAIPGASKPENAEDSVRAMELTLLPRDLAELDAAFPTP